ncbi:MAG TPA: hypothetical protein VNJ01_07725 [Bacteriovoracaceae bacterium]|nr:hypothetical protein [Bacteriovoracaceae bacterium]
MTKTSSILFLFLFLISCNKQAEVEKQTTTPRAQATSPAALPVLSVPAVAGQAPKATPEVPAAALSWDADIYMVNFDSTQEGKIQSAVELIKKVVASKVFKDRVLDYTYNGKKQFVDNGGFTNAQIYQKLLDGAENMGNRTKNNTMDVELELYYENTSTIGYTYPNTARIWMNKKFFNNYSATEVADNLMHEWVHKLGFSHAMKWSKKRDHSVPYAIGYLVEELAGTL